MSRPHGAALFENLGGEILTPWSIDDAYDEMLRSLHEVTEIHDPYYKRDGNADEPFYMHDYYKHLAGVVTGATKESYMDMSELTWPGRDWQVNGGKFLSLVIYGTTSNYKFSINAPKGEAVISDFEQGTLRRLGQRTLLSMNPSLLNSIVRSSEHGDWANDERYLCTGYVVVPKRHVVDIKNSSGNVTGDSVRQALYPHSNKLFSIAANLALEAKKSAAQARV